MSSSEIIKKIEGALSYRKASLSSTIANIETLEDISLRKKISKRVLESLGDNKSLYMNEILGAINGDIVELFDSNTQLLEDLELGMELPEGYELVDCRGIVGLIEAFDEDPGSDWVPADGREMDQTSDNRLYDVLGDVYNLSINNTSRPWMYQSGFNRDDNLESISKLKKTMAGDLGFQGTSETVELDGRAWSIDFTPYTASSEELLVFRADVHTDSIGPWSDDSIILNKSGVYRNGDRDRGSLVKLDDSKMAFISYGRYFILGVNGDDLEELDSGSIYPIDPGGINEEIYSFTKQLNGLTYIVIVSRSRLRILDYGGGGITDHYTLGSISRGISNFTTEVPVLDALVANEDYVFVLESQITGGKIGYIPLSNYINDDLSIIYFTDDSPAFSNFNNGYSSDIRLISFTVGNRCYLITTIGPNFNNGVSVTNLLEVTGSPGSLTLNLLLSNVDGVGDPIPTAHKQIRLENELVFPVSNSYYLREGDGSKPTILTLENDEIISSRYNDSMHPDMIRHSKIQGLESLGYDSIVPDASSMSLVCGGYLYYVLYDMPSGSNDTETALLIRCELDEEGVVIENTHQLVLTRELTDEFALSAMFIYNSRLYIFVSPTSENEVGTILRYDIVNNDIQESTLSTTSISPVGNTLLMNSKIVTCGRFLYVHGLMSIDMSDGSYGFNIQIFEIMDNGDLVYVDQQYLGKGIYGGMFFHRGKAYVSSLTELDSNTGFIEINEDGHALHIFDIEEDGTLTRSGEIMMPDDPDFVMPLLVSGITTAEGVYITTFRDFDSADNSTITLFCSYNEELGVLDSIEVLTGEDGLYLKTMADSQLSIIRKDYDGHFSITKSMLYYTGNREITGIPFQGGYNDYSFATDKEAKTSEGKFNLPNIPGSYVKVK